MSNAKIGQHNLLDDETVTASTEAAGFEKEKAYDGLVFDFWKPTAVPAWLKASGSMPVGMFLGDTTEESLVGGELVSNGDFSSDTVWIKDSSWTIAAGVASCDGTQVTQETIRQNGILTVGDLVVVTFTVSNYSAGYVRPVVGSTGAGTFVNANGTYTETLTVVGSSNFFIQADVNFIGDIDNVSVTIADPDLSANNNGLGVFGTVVKTSVGDSGLASYDGWSASNYLKQPYNADLDFGSTNDFCYMGWIKLDSLGSTVNIFDRADSDGSNRVFGAFITGTGGLLRFYIEDGAAGSSSIDTPTDLIVTDTFYHFAMVRDTSGTGLKIYLNGVLVKSATVTARDVSSSDSTGALFVGVNYAAASAFTGDITLFRNFDYAITAADILDIYNKEKNYFKAFGTLPETLISTSATTADYFAMYAHDFGGTGSSVVLQYSDDDSTWTDAFPPIYPADSKPIFKPFTRSSHKYWRAYIDGAVQKIGVCMFGKATEFERGLTSGYQAITLASENMPINSESANGNFLGRSNKVVPIKGTLAIKSASSGWIRYNWPSILADLENKPFVALPHPELYPDEAAFCWSDGDIKAPTYSDYAHLDFRIRLKARIT